jgi:hypothetical protein
MRAGTDAGEVQDTLRHDESHMHEQVAGRDEGNDHQHGASQKYHAIVGTIDILV